MDGIQRPELTILHGGPNRKPRADSIFRREPEPARPQGALGEIEETLHEEREQGGRHRALEHEPHIVEADAGEDGLPQAAGGWRSRR
jgi:hypothetical protein